MAFEYILAAVNTVLAALVLIYVLLYFYFWKMHPGGDFHVLRTPYFTLIAIGLFAISNLLLVFHIFSSDNSLDASLLLSGIAMALVFVAFYAKVKRNAYEMQKKAVKKKR